MKKQLALASAILGLAVSVGAPVVSHAAYQLNDEVKDPTPALKEAAAIGVRTHNTEALQNLPNKDAIVVMSFGTTFKDTRAKTIDATVDAIKAAHPNTKVITAFTSHIIRDRIQQKEGITYPTPEEALAELKMIPSDWLAKNIEQVSQRLFSNHHFERKNAIGALVNFFITHVRWKVTGNFDEPLLRYNAELPQDVIAALNVFKKFVWKYVIRHVETQRIEYKGQRILTEMFQIFESDPERLLPTNTANRWRNAPEQGKKRIICDYIAGMSDAYALKVYHQL